MKMLFKKFLLASFATLLLLSAGCDLADKGTGVDKKAGTAASDGGPFGEVVRSVDGFLPAPFNLATKLALSGISLYQAIRLKQKDGIIDASQKVLDATAAGLKTFVKANPAHAEILADHIEAAHIDAEVDPSHTAALVQAVAPPKV